MNLNLNGSKPDISDETFNPDKSVFLLLADVSMLVFGQLNETLRAEEMQKSERQILNALNNYDGRNQLDLVKATGLKPPTVSVALSKLEEKGYVKRVLNETDHRSVLVYLDERGKEYCTALRELLIGLQDDSLVGLTEIEVDNLLKSLNQIKRRLINRNNRKK
jgi:DNA-binding MarR family transcriptional regulator